MTWMGIVLYNGGVCALNETSEKCVAVESDAILLVPAKTVHANTAFVVIGCMCWL